MSSQKLIRITSTERDLTIYPNSNDFAVKFDNVESLQNVSSIVLKHASFTNTFYNIDNDSLQLLYQGGAVNIFISDGKQWTIYDLLDYLNSVGGWPTSHNWTYDPKTNKITIIADATHTIQILSGTLLAKLGLASQSSVQTADFTGPYQINLSGIQHVFIYSKTLGQGKNMIKGKNQQDVSVLAMIPCDVPFGSVKHYETNHDNLDIVNFKNFVNLQDIDISLRDGQGRLLDTSNHHVSLVLKIIYQ